MVSPVLFECSFFVPIRRDADFAVGAKHRPATWRWLDDQLFALFGGGTMAPGHYEGSYTDPDTGQRVHDKSRKFIVAIADAELERLRALLRQACQEFQQKCIYLSVAGHVEFIRQVDEG